nr:GPI mannosyltransferase 3 [Hydra vulgaris]
MRNRSTKTKNKNHENHMTDNVGLPWSTKEKLFISVALRLFSVFLTRTFFVPDEYWQSTEVAHYNVFGYGYLTWEWKQKIRSYFYPFLFEIYFRTIKLFAIDSLFFIVYGPHVMQALLTSCCDLSVYYSAFNLFGSDKIASLAFFNQICSWFLIYTGSRTLSNTAEMCFSTLGIFYLFASTSKSNFFLSLLLGGISCIIRPTSVIIWFPLVLRETIYSKRSIKNIAVNLIFVTSALLMLMLGVDFYFYKQFVLTHWNFLQFNLIEDMSQFYGSHPFYWYFFEGLPVVFGFSIAFIFLGAIKCKKQRFFLWIILLYVIAHSFISHKEFRFMLPTIPIASFYAGYGLNFLSTLISKKKFYMLLVVLVISNTFVALYFCLIHQRGSIDVMKYLSAQSSRSIKVLFLMPCHSTPYYSYLHRNVSLQFLTCHPSSELSYVEEAEAFYFEPISWLNEIAAFSKTHVVFYNVIPESVKIYFQDIGFKQVASFFHTHFPEGRIGSHIVVYEAANGVQQIK